MNSVYRFCDNVLLFLETRWSARLFVIVLVTIATVLIWRTYTPDNPPVPTAEMQQEIQQVMEVSPTPVTLQEITKYHSAIARTTHIDQSCYDEKTRLWFIHSTLPDDDSWPEGWYYSSHDDLSTITIGNGTISITNIDNVFNDRISPDVSGLNCVMHTPLT